MFPNLSADIKRYVRDPKDPKNIYLFFEQGIWAIAVYRFGRWAHRLRVTVVRLILKKIAFMLFKFIDIKAGKSLPASAEIGKGFYIGHFGGIILHSVVKIGENCSVGPGVVIGTKGLGAHGAPGLGNSVYVGVGAKILGSIKIGNDVRIGANAVVIDDVPDGMTAVGVPAHFIKGAVC
jgi:serine O-acetyltransferase